MRAALREAVLIATCVAFGTLAGLLLGVAVRIYRELP